MKRTRLFSTALTIISFLSVNSIHAADKVTSQVGENANFSSYKTYSWLAPKVLTKVGVIDNHPANPVLKEIVGGQLVQAGLSEVAEGGDLLVQAFVLSESSPQLEAVIMAEGPGMMYGTTVATMGRYNKEGTLALNLIDRQTKKSAWFAMVKDSLPNRTLKPEEIRSKLDKAARNLFKKYPVKK